MKRIILLLTILASAGTVFAEDIIQVMPFHAVAGTTYKSSDKKGFAIHMTNGALRAKALEFEFILPEGMAVATNSAGTIYRMSGLSERFYVYDEEEEEDVTYYTASMSLTDGVYKMLIVYGLDAPDDCAISGNSGEMLTLYYTTTAEMADGVYPIYVKNAKISFEDGSKGYPENSSSYVIIGEDTSADLNLSGMTGYVPSFVVNALNTDMAANASLRSLNLNGATELGAELTVPENVVWQTATSGGLSRTFPAGQWSTVCLPFALTAEQVTAVKDKGCEIEQLSNFTESTNTVAFKTATAMEANTPYIVKSTTAQPLFDGIEGVTIGDLSATTNITKGKLTMAGTYEPKTLNSDASNTYYVYDAADGAFVRVGSNATVKPFRGYISVSGAGARVLNFNDGATVVNEVKNAETPTAIYTLQGIRSDAKTKGLYIANGKKYVVK